VRTLILLFMNSLPRVSRAAIAAGVGLSMIFSTFALAVPAFADDIQTPAIDTATTEVVVDAPAPVVEQETVPEASAPVAEEPAPVVATGPATEGEVLGATAETAVEVPAPLTPVATPTLSTDKDDYHPGTIATIFGNFFGALQSIVLHIFGSDDNDQNYTDATQTVTTDASGSFSAAYTLDDLYRPFYQMTASAPDGTQLAQGMFRDSSVGTYDQCSNDLGTGYVTGDTGCRWTNGNIQSNNSLYAEGDSTVQRLWMEGYAPGSTHTVTFQYGTTKAGKHAYDFLTTWDASENWVTLADRCQDITGCTTASETTLSVPHDSNGSGQFESGTRNFVMRGGTMSSATAPAIVSGTYASDSETAITVSFTVDSSGAMCKTKSGVTSCGIAIWFGAHIANGSQWTAFNGSTGAGSISGSPYHVALDKEDGASVGQRDNQMQAGAIVVPSTITIHKVTSPIGGTGFAFTTTGTGYNGFSLDHGQQNQQSVAPGSYTVTETNPSPNYANTALTCTASGTGSSATPNLGTRSVAITVGSGGGAVIDCTYTNTLQQGHLIVQKTTVPASDSTVFSITASGSGTITAPAASTVTDALDHDYTVTAGTYSVAETVPVGWDKTGDTCQGVVVAAGQTATCLITNVKRGHLVVQKTTIPAADPTSFSITASGSGTITGGGAGSITDAVDQNYEVTPGTYNVAETVPTGWTKTGDTCQGVVVAAGQTANCLITNTKIPTLKLVKTVTNDNGGTKNPVDWTLAATGAGGFSDAGNSTIFHSVTAGVAYALSESVVAGYTAGAWSCDGGTQGGSNITLSAGQNVTCTINNNDNAAHLIVIKHVDNGTTGATTLASAFTTSITGVTTAAPSAAGAEAPGVDNTLTTVGAYSVDEGAHVGYTKSLSAECSGTIALGETKTCTIINTAIAPKLKLVKTVVNDNGGLKVVADFPLFVDATGVTSGVSNASTVGAHTATETSDPGYTASVWGGDCATDGTVTLALADDKTCTITNDDKPAHLIVIKHVVNDNGGTAVASGFSTTITGVTTAAPTAAGVESPGINSTLTTVGAYSVDEGAHVGYTKSLSADCSGTIALGETKTCTITNDDIQPKLTLTKIVVNDNGGTATVASFPLFVDATGVTSGVQNGVNAGAHTASETGNADYTASSWSGDCAADGSVTLLPGDVKACTITNDDKAPALHLRKVIVNDNGGTATVSDFTLTANGAGANDLSGTSPVDSGAGLKADTFALSENAVAGYTASSWVCAGGTQDGANITLSLGQEATCTITNDDQQAYIVVDKTVTNDNGGTAQPNDFLLKVDGNAVSDAIAYPVNPGSHTASETLLPGYAAGSWGGDCALDATVSVALGQTKTCTITNNDIAPKLHLRKVVVNDNGGTKTAADFPLSANGTDINDLSGTSPVDSGAGLLADTWTLSETSATGYAASDWVCIGGTQNGANITVGIGGEATCTITNNDIPAHLIVIKHVINDNGGTKVAGDFSTTISSVSTATPTAAGVESPGVDNTLTTVGAYSVDEGAHVGYTKSLSADCSGTIALGETKTCTITNDDQVSHLIVIKHVVNHGGSAIAGNFTMNITGTNVANPSSAGAEAPGTDHTLNTGSYSVDESVNADYTKTLSADCSGSIALGETKTCTITNEEKTAKLTIVKDAQPNDLIDFSFNGGQVLGSFLLDDDAGVADKGLNGDVDRDQSKTFTNLNTGSYTVTETEPNAFWVLGGASCVVTGTVTPVTSNLSGAALSLVLTPGADVTCTFVNNKNSPTRTQGFWQTHTDYTLTKFAAIAPFFVGVNNPVVLGTHKGILTTTGQLFGAFYSSIPKLTTGTQRTALDKARMQLLQQLVTAKLNCATFGCSTTIQGQIAAADAAYAGTSASAILTSAGLMDAYNNSGDTIVIGNAGKATPKTSQGLADKAFWDLP
jgi:hypothetical protein